MRTSRSRIRRFRGVIGAAVTLCAISAIAGALAIVDVTVIPMTGTALVPQQTVVVRDERIIAIGRRENVAVPKGAIRIDRRKRYLVPGLVDSHVHLWAYSRGGAGDRRVERRVLTMLLANGVTTGIVMEGSADSLLLRDAINRGEEVGPRLYTAGPLIQMADSGAPPGRTTFTTVEEVTREVLREKQAGFDFVKVHGALLKDSYEALLSTARRVGLPVIGHVPDNLGIDAALDGRQKQITHAESYLQTYFKFQVPFISGSGVWGPRTRTSRIPAAVGRRPE